jgi:hypothetical protein
MPEKAVTLRESLSHGIVGDSGVGHAAAYHFSGGKPE